MTAYILRKTDGALSMAHSDQMKPWWGLGNSMGTEASFDDWIKGAGFDFKILKSPVFYVLTDQMVEGIETDTRDTAELETWAGEGHGRFQRDLRGGNIVDQAKVAIAGQATNGDGVTRPFAKFPERYALVRDDNGAPLSIMSKRYNIVQPNVVMQFFRDVCEEHGFAMHTAGVLKGGGTYWALAKLPQNGTIRNHRHEAYLLLATSCDGSLATHARFTDVCVQCWNTLEWSISGREERGTDGETKSAVKVIHSTEFKPDVVKKQLGLADFDRTWADMQETLGRLAETPVNTDDARAFFSELLRPGSTKAKPRQDLEADSFEQLVQGAAGGGYHKVETDQEKPERAIRGLDKLMEVYEHAPGASPGNAYGLVQGVTRFVDHERGKDRGKRLTSAWFGQGNKLKQQAVAKAVEMAA